MPLRHQNMPKSRWRLWSQCSRGWNDEGLELLPLQEGKKCWVRKTHWSEITKSPSFLHSTSRVPLSQGQPVCSQTPDGTYSDHVTFSGNAINTKIIVETCSCSLENPFKSKRCKTSRTQKAQATVREGERKTWVRWVQPSLLSFSLHTTNPGLQELLHLDPSAQISLVYTIPALHALHPYIKAIITLLSHRCLWIQMCSVCSPVLWASSYADLP